MSPVLPASTATCLSKNLKPVCLPHPRPPTPAVYGAGVGLSFHRGPLEGCPDAFPGERLPPQSPPHLKQFHSPPKCPPGERLRGVGRTTTPPRLRRPHSCSGHGLAISWSVCRLVVSYLLHAGGLMEGEKSNYSILGHVRAIELSFPLAKGESRKTIAMFQPVLKSSTAAAPSGECQMRASPFSVAADFSAMTSMHYSRTHPRI